MNNSQKASEIARGNIYASSHNILKLFSRFEQNVSIHAYALVLFLGSILISGYVVYSSNQSLQLALVNLLNNPSLYPNDPFGATLPYYASMLWRVVALATQFIPLEPLLLTLFLLERLLVIYAAGHLAQTFVPQSKLAVIGAMALFALGIKPILGGGTLVTSNFEQTGLSVPFFLLATAAFYNSRPILCAVWLAIGFNLNSMYGTYAITYLGAVFLLDSTYRREWRKWLLYFGLFLLLASPAIWLTISAFGRKAPDTQLWLIASQVRFPYHLYPLTWSKGDFGKFGVLVFLLVAFLHQNRHQLQKLFKQGLIWTGVSLLWLLYAFVAAYIAKSPSMLVMHPGRGTDLWYCFAGIALVSICATKVEQSKGRMRRSLLVAVFSASFLIWHPIVGPYIMAVALLCFTVQPVWYYILGKGSSSRIALLLTLWVVLLGFSNFHSRLAKTKSIEAALIGRPSPSSLQIAQWASANTPIEAVFLVDPDWGNFRAIAKRSAFVNWKDGSAILWDRSFVKPWTERLKIFGLDITQPGLTEEKGRKKLNSLYEKLTDEEVKRLQSRFPINYWVVPVKHPSTFPVAFQNQSYKILNVK